MPLRSPSPPIRELIRNLTSADRARVQAARARLTILSGRAVEALIDTLEGGNNRLKLQVMPLLALIRDSRALHPLLALLMDRDPKIRETAARALARFPSREAICGLGRVVKEEPAVEVRVAAVQSLASIFDEGHEDSLREVLSVLFDTEESQKVRLTSFAVVPLLRTRERRAVLRRLRNDPDREVAAKARDFEEDAARDDPEDAGLAERLASELASPDYERWNAAMHRLIGLGSAILPALIAEMRARHKDPEFTSRAAMVLKGLGPRRLRPVVDYLQTVVEPLPLEVLVEVVCSIGDKPLIYRMRDLIASIDERSARANGFAGPDPYARVRGRAHVALARIGSRVAVGDLQKTLRDPRRRLDVDLLAAVGRIGTRRVRIGEVFWQILRRDKIRPRGASFEAIGGQDRAALEEILDKGRGAGAHGLPHTPPLPGLRPRQPRP